MPALSIPKILPRIQDPDLEFRKYLNLLVSLRERRRNEEQLRSRPFEVTIDPTTTCQLACPYCEVGNGSMTRTLGVLKEETHLKMIEELGDELFVIWYFSTGEPLLNKNLDRIVSATRDKEIFSTISTNLSLPLSDERIDAVLQCGLSCISVSLDGASAETYVQYRRKGQFDLVVENLRRLVERKRALGLEFPLIEWRFLAFAHNYHEVATARKLAADWGVDLLEFFPGYAPPAAENGEVALMPQGVSLEPAHDGPAWRRAQERDDTLLARTLRNEPYVHSYSGPESVMGAKCDWLYFGSMLFPNESISPCCVSNNEPDDFGRLDDQTNFAMNWNNTKFRDARASFRADGADRGQDLVCQRCPSRPSQDYQFMTTVRGLLRNAPEWALKVLVRDPDAFFHRADFELMPSETAALRDGRIAIPGGFPEIAARIAEREPTPDLDWIREVLSAAPAPAAADPAPIVATQTRRLPRWIERTVRGSVRSDDVSLIARTPPEARAALEECVWHTNAMPRTTGDAPLLHLGCGDNPLPGFVNLDFLPESPQVAQWDLLQAWPEALTNQVAHAFSEDVLEHFYFDEQLYLLAQLGVALQPGGVFRALMPSVESLLSVRTGFDPSDDYLAENFGVRTGSDALNLGMRFGGHRWLHDIESAAHLGALAGFEATTTSCAESKIPALCGINLRDETNSLSFAQDFEQSRLVERWTLAANRVIGARPHGELSPGQPLYESTAASVQIHYPLPEEITAESIVVMAFRGANLTQRREHNYANAYLVERPDRVIPVDSSMRSCLHTTFLGADLIRARSAGDRTRSIRFDPSSARGDHFSVGPLELFLIR